MDHPSQKTRLAIDLTLLVGVAALFRMWGLGKLGLYGDEELTALAVRGVLEDGYPHMPSGMPYWRAAPFSYAVAGLAALLGLGESVLRLLPATLGSLTPAGLYLLGRRLGLDRQVALAAGATLALSGWHVDLSREGRMYAPFLAALIWNLVLFVDGFVGGRRRAAVGALALAPVTLLLHELSVTLVLFWAVVLVVGWHHVRHRAWLAGGVVAGAVFWAASLKLSKGFVPRSAPAASGSGDSLGERILDLFYLDFRPPWELAGTALAAPVVATLLVAAGVIGLLAIRRAALDADLRSVWVHAAAVLAVGLAVAELFGLLLALLWLVALIAAGRPAGFVAHYPRFALAVAGTLAAIAAGWIVFAAAGPAFAGAGAAERVIAGVRDMLGWPAPHVRVFLDVFPVMTLVVVAGTLVWMVRGAADDPGGTLQRALFLWLWLPLIALGFARQWIALRYALPLYPFFVLVWARTVVGGVAGVVRLAGEIPGARGAARRLRWAPLAVATGCLLVPVLNEQHGVGPALYWSRLDYGQRTDELIHGFPFHPDHAGAGRFVRERLRPGDRVVAMDAQQQSHYAGQVDYRLVRLNERKTFGTYVDGVLRDIYTHAEVLETLAELERVVAERGDGRVWLITSAEMVGPRARVVPEGVPEWLDARRERLAFTGRDGATAVYLID